MSIDMKIFPITVDKYKSVSKHKRPKHHRQEKLNSPVKYIANDYHVHCAYGDDVFSSNVKLKESPTNEAGQLLPEVLKVKQPEMPENRATGEHVKLYSKFSPEELKDGHPDMGLDNILPVCFKHNEERGNEDLSKFINAKKKQRLPDLYRTLSELEPISQHKKYINSNGKEYSIDFDGKKYVVDMLNTLSTVMRTPLKEFSEGYEKYKKDPEQFIIDLARDLKKGNNHKKVR